MERTTYPFSPEFQIKILAALLRDRNLLPSVGSDIIDPDYFDSPQLAAICASLLEYWQQQRQLPDIATLETFLFGRNGQAIRDKKLYVKIFAMLREDPLENLEFVRDQILVWARRQGLTRALEQSLQIVRDGQEEEFGSVRGMIDQALLVGVEETGYDYYGRVGERLRMLVEGDASRTKVPSGFRSVDRLMKGGPDAGDLVVVAAQSKGGKTAFLVNVAIAGVYAGRNVIYVTLEVRKRKLAYRFDRSFAGMTFHDIEKSPTKARRKILGSKKLRGDLRILEFGRGILSVNALQDYLLKMEGEGFDPGLVVVDYAALMKAQHRTESRREAIAEISGDLRSLAGFWEIPVWSGHQTSKAALHKKHPSKADLAECYELSAIVDSLFAIARTPEEKDLELGRLYMLDQREHKEGEIIYLETDLDRMRVSELKEDDLKRKEWMDEFLGRGRDEVEPGQATDPAPQ